MYVSKQQYMREFDAAKNGPLHEQPFVIHELEAYDKAKAKMTMKHCVRCKNRRITVSRLKHKEWWCDRCWKERKSVLQQNIDINSYVFNIQMKLKWILDLNPNVLKVY